MILSPMTAYFTAVFSDLERHSEAWTSLPREAAVERISGYRSLAETLASQYGAAHQNFTGDGHLFLFEAVDVAVQFSLALVVSWNKSPQPGSDRSRSGLRIGCHFGDAAPLANGVSWVGRAIVLAKRIESLALPNAVLISESVLEMLDLALYSYEEAGRHALKGDHLKDRALYRITGVDEAALLARRIEDLSAEECFLRALAATEVMTSNPAEGLRWYREALKRRSDYPEAHNNLAIMLRESNDTVEAGLHYREALRGRPEYPEAHYNYALLLASAGSLSGATHHLREAIRLRPDYVDAHHALANLIKVRGDLDEAAALYRRTLELRPGYAEAHNDFAGLLHEQGETGLAKDHYQQALRLRAEYPEAHYNYALLLEDVGQLLAAQSHYQQAIEIWPDYAEAHNNLAALLHSQSCLDEAKPHYERALELRPADPETHYNYALLLRVTGDLKSAERHLAIARDLAPDQKTFRSEIERSGPTREI